MLHRREHIVANLSLNPDGSPTKVLDDFRKRKIREREDHGQVTPHFHLNEFHTKDARGSAVPVSSWDAVIRLCEDYLEPMRAKFGKCMVLSGYRHRVYNDSIGGARHSQHIYDETPGSVAADTRYERGTSQQWVAEAKRLRTQLGKGGIGRYDQSGFIHIDNREGKVDWQGN
jgi:Peptidase M15